MEQQSASVSRRSDRDSSEHRNLHQTHVEIDCVTSFKSLCKPYCSALVHLPRMDYGMFLMTVFLMTATAIVCAARRLRSCFVCAGVSLLKILL